MEYLFANLSLAGLIFAIGAAGLFIKRNAISMFMCIELMLNAGNLALVTFGAWAGGSQSLDGALLVLFVITVAAAEAGVGLALIIRTFNDQGSVNVDKLEALRG